MHIPPLENNNQPIVDINDSRVPLNYFNIVKLKKDQSFEYIVPGYETCIVPATGTVDIEVVVGLLVGKRLAVSRVAVYGHDSGVARERSARRGNVGLVVFLPPRNRARRGKAVTGVIRKLVHIIYRADGQRERRAPRVVDFTGRGL